MDGASPRQGRPGAHRDITVLVEDVIRRRMTGECVDDQTIIDAHPALMPELGRRLHALRVAEEAERRAERAALRPPLTGADTLGEAAPSPPPDAVPGCEIIREIHRGGQGVVFRATQTTTGRDVAVKFMRTGPFTGPHDRARFRREVRVLAALDHPHIVTVHESGSAAGHFYFVMDYIAGDPLDAYMADHDLTVDTTLDLFAKICEAVNAAHLHGVIHRDLKPSNIRVDPAGEPHVLDFGLAKLDSGNDDPRSRSRTATGQFVGSLPWASPEQVDGLPDRIDLRTDVYSLGVILFQMLTERFPYPVGGTTREIMDHITGTEPARPGVIRPEINNEVETIVLKCLSKERERRYQSAGELARDVRHYLVGEPIEAKRDSTWYVFKKTLRRYRVPALIASAFLLLIAGFGVAMSLMYRDANREAEQNRRLTACLEELFEFQPADAPGGRISVRDLLDRHAERIAAGLEDQPEILTRFAETVAGKYRQLGAYRDALGWWEKVIDLRQSDGSVDDRALAGILRRTVALNVVMASFEEAEARYRQALARLRRVTQGPDADLVRLLWEHANLFHHKGDYDGAKRSSERALKMARELHPGDHPLVAAALYRLAGMLHDRSEYEAAETCYRESLDMWRRLDADHPQSLINLEYLGLLLKDRGDYVAAEPLIRQALDGYRRREGEDGAASAGGHLSLAKLYTDGGDLPAAESACRKALELHTSIYGADHLFTARPLTLLGRILVTQRRFAEAEPLLRKALAIREQRKPPGHWKTAKTRSVLGAALAGMGRFEEAEPLLLDSFPVIAEDRGRHHRRTREAGQRVVELYAAWEKPELAAEWRAEFE